MPIEVIAIKNTLDINNNIICEKGKKYEVFYQDEKEWWIKCEEFDGCSTLKTYVGDPDFEVVEDE